MSAPLTGTEGESTSPNGSERQQAEIVYHLLTDPRFSNLREGGRKDVEDGDVAHLIDRLRPPASSTQKLRGIQALRQAAQQGPPGWPLVMQCLLRLVEPNIVIHHQVGVSGEPTVPLLRYRPWRDLVQWVDEELLAALAVAAWAIRAEPWRRADLIWAHCCWPVFLRPADRDFADLLQAGIEDSHVHFGELTPAMITWREFLDETWVPTPACAEALDLGNLGIQARAARKQLLRAPGLSRVRRALLEVSRYGHTRDVPLQGRLPGALLRSYLRPERFLLSYCFAALATAGQRTATQKKGEQPIAALTGPHLQPQEVRPFWEYVRQRCLFWRQLGPSQTGFEAFVKEQQLDGEYLRPELQARLVVDFLADSQVQRLDVRCVVKKGTAGIKSAHRQKIRRYQGYLREYANPALVPMVFQAVGSHLKGKAHTETDRCFGTRLAPGWRGLRRAVLTWTRRTLRDHAVAGLDMIQSEYGFDPGVVAPAYRLTAGQHLLPPREAGRENSFTAESRPRLRRYYHTGEDTDHPITAARIAWQAVHWLDLGAGDRLGHVTFLSLEPAAYTARETVGERLDNLLWLSQVSPSSAESAEWRHQLSDLCDETYRDGARRPRVADLAKAADWLPLPEPAKADESDELAWLVYLSICGFDDAPFQPAAPPWLQAIAALAKQCRGRRQEWLDGRYSSHAVTAALAALSGAILQAGVLIETCPTSNLVIGSQHEAGVPGARFVASELQSVLVIGTDDPSMLLTDLPAELALAASQLLHDRPEIARRAVMQRLRELSQG